MEYIQTYYQRFVNEYPNMHWFCNFVGSFFVLYRLFLILRFIYAKFIRRPYDLNKRYGDGSWIFITGSSDGIGRAFAHAFAKRGFNLILSARTESKLQKVRQECQNINKNIQTKILPADYKLSYKSGFFDPIMQQIKQLDISVVINNVGVDVLSYYHELSQQQILDLITVNCVPISIFSKKFLPQLRARNKKSALINVASVAGQTPLALHNVYSASKAFDDFLTRSLSYEYPQVDIICLRPSEVSTPMTYHKKPDLMTILPQQCVEGLLRDLGYQKQSNGHWNHSLQSALYSIVPQNLYNYVFKNYIGPEFIKERKIAIEASKKQK